MNRFKASIDAFFLHRRHFSFGNFGVTAFVNKGRQFRIIFRRFLRQRMTRSYRQVAEHIGQPRAVRAVAGACAANSLAVIVPCHRVVREDGALSGYRWGTARKAQLLAREAQREEE